MHELTEKIMKETGWNLTRSHYEVMNPIITSYLTKKAEELEVKTDSNLDEIRQILGLEVKEEVKVEEEGSPRFRDIEKRLDALEAKVAPRPKEPKGLADILNERSIKWNQDTDKSGAWNPGDHWDKLADAAINWMLEKVDSLDALTLNRDNPVHWIDKDELKRKVKGGE